VSLGYTDVNSGIISGIGNFMLMKFVLFLILISCLFDKGYAQYHPLRQSICVLNKVPVLIESDPIIFRWKDQKLFEMGTGRIRVRLAPRQSSIEFDHLIQVAAPLPFKEQEKLSVFLVQDSSHNRSKYERRINPDELLMDSVMQVNQGLFLIWKNENSEIVQKVGFMAKPLVPQITGYRFNRNFDSLDNSVHAKQHKRKSYISLGYEKFNGQYINVDPGDKLTLTLQTYPLLTDTVIQYRLTRLKDRKEGLWKMTGHILALPELVEGNAYELELRYPNQLEQITYHLNVRPYWYQIIWVRVSALILLVAIAVFVTRFFYQRRLRKVTEQRKRLQERLTTLQSQLNPHFIFNSINSIEGLIIEENTQEANHYLSIFSSIMREALKNSDKTLVSLEEEIALMEKYIQIEQLRFGFQYSIQIGETISLAEIEVPPMLLQPVIENAVKHGASTLGEKGWIKIVVSLSGTSMVICISNNAADKKSSQPTAGGYGLTFTEQKIQHLKALFPSTPIEFSLDVSQGEAKAVFIFQDWMA